MLADVNICTWFPSIETKLTAMPSCMLFCAIGAHSHLTCFCIYMCRVTLYNVLHVIVWTYVLYEVRIYIHVHVHVHVLYRCTNVHVCV